jgi:hypothetical protein
MTCHTCKYWCRGTITVFADDATDWEGRPHPKAGKTEIDRIRFDCHDDDQDVGVCNAPFIEGKTMIVGTCELEGIYGEVVTDADFHCMLHETGLFENDEDHYHRETFTGRNIDE